MAFLVVVVLLSVLICSGHCLSCYSCNAQKGQNSGCEKINPLNPVGTETCLPENICVAYTFRNPTSAIETITRKCGVKNVCQTLKLQETDYNKLVECRTCSVDKCEASGANLNHIVGHFTIALVFLIKLTF